VGSVAVGIGPDVYLTGLSATASSGSVLVTGDADVIPVGVFATGYVTPVNVWGIIDDNQGAVWTEVPDSQTDTWSVVDDSNSATWNQIVT
jgi:hypothetical protein